MAKDSKTLAGFPLPPGSSLGARRIAAMVAAPVDRFLRTETSGGILLLVATAVALIWANSPWHHSYEHLWHTPVTIGVGTWAFTQTLHFWINDLLMTVFFLVAGLEIKREMVHGELADLKRAALPIGAAVGGMLVPAALYAVFNHGGAASSGWGIPMATDIAFAVGILQLLGNRVTAALRILLLALAIIDDIGAILVIALFYSESIQPIGLEVGAVGVVLLFVFIRLGVRPGPLYILPMLLLWSGLFKAGIHPTIAGVIVGLAMPARPWLSREVFTGIATRALVDYQALDDANHSSHDLLRPIKRLTVAGREAVSPVVRLESFFHPWVAYGIMPLFALANAGVHFGGMNTSLPGALAVVGGITLGLAVGKPIGVMLAAWILTKAGICKLPRGVTWSGVLVIGMAAGIGFTMSIFIAGMALPEPAMLELGKLGVLLATAIAGIATLVLGRLLLEPPTDPALAGLEPSDVETSNEF